VSGFLFYFRIFYLLFIKKVMLLHTDLKKMSVPEKAKLFSLLSDDKELQDYMISNEKLFEELNRRDKEYAEGQIQLTTRQELSLRLKKRRDASMPLSRNFLLAIQ